MENFIPLLTTQYKKYKDNKLILEKLKYHLEVDMPKMLITFERQIKEKKKYIENFLSSEQCYYYVKETDLFISYDSEHYNKINEDEIWHKILTETSQNIYLHTEKQNIKNEIIESIKNRELFTSIPESFTIQHLLDNFTATIFSTKEDAKFFLTILGDNILNKNTNICHFISKDGDLFNVMTSVKSFVDVYCAWFI